MVSMAVASSLTERDLEVRKDFINASEAPKVMGTSDWGNAFDVFLEKSEQTLGITLEPVKPTVAMAWGTLMEGPILTYTELRLREYFNRPDLKLTRKGIRRRHKNGIMAATLDSRVEDMAYAVEAKTHASVHPNVNLDDWGDEFSDAIPAPILDQVLAQLACAPDLEGIFVVLSACRHEPTIYLVLRANHLERIVAIETACCDLWDNHILTGIPPAGNPTLATMKRVKAPIDPAAIATLEDVAIEELKQIREQLNALKKKEEGLNAGIRANMIGKLLGRSPKGHMITIKTVSVRGYTVEPGTQNRMNITMALGY